MLQLYNVFYRETGVRRFNELYNPRLAVFKGFPRKSIFHHFTPTDDAMFPDASKSYFHGYSKRIPLDLVYRSTMMLGHPRQLPFVPTRYTLPFIKNHHLFRYMPNAAEFPIDERTLIVIDYNPLKFAYRYFHTPISEFQQWEGYQKTFWSNIGQLAMKSNKQHFVLMDPITEIPSFNMLMNFADKQGMTLAHLFNTHSKRLVLHLSNFIKDEMRERSVFNLIPIEALKRVNIIFMLKDGRCSTLNLAYLYSWIKGDENVSTLKITFQRDQKQMVRAMLKYLLVISAGNPDDAVEHPPEPVEHEDSDELETDEELEHSDDNEFVQDFKKNIKPVPTPEITSRQETLRSVEEIESTPEHLLSSVDEDMVVLEKKTQQDLHLRGITLKGNEVVETRPEEIVYTHEEVRKEINTALAPNDALKAKLTLALEDGTLNPASYKKALQDSEKYTKMKDPYGSDVLVIDKTKINPQALLIKPESTEMKDHTVVLDKSMTKSVLHTYTRDYVAKHLKDDIIKMVGGLQKGGVIVQRHEVTIEHTVMGSVENHNIELKPIDGVASSLWFKLPVIEHDGTFKIGGNKYLNRNQRVDLPIRKISPTEIALSSYYGKTFVSTENKVASSSSAWILKQIEKASFLGSDWINNVVPGDTFDSYQKTPYIYGMISTRFISFTAGDIRFNFNNDQNIRMTAPRSIPDARWCGYKGDTGTATVWVDKNNIFHVLQDGTLTDLGDIYKVLQLDPHESPIRFSELALFRKNVPVGVILGYRLGWSKLLALLQVKPRFVEPRKRLNLTDDEYPIQFADGVFIFSRKDRFATMILAGYMDYIKITRTASVKDFEHKDIYLNLLGSKGLGAIYIREIDMLFDYFVDPITEEILQDMKEPLTFEGLLLRSTEMLMTYDHPKVYDGSFTRIRGYERLAGAVYREMAQAVRQFRSKNIAGRSKIDISPYKVWQSLNEDPTKMLVPEINPVQDLKNQESVTYVGEGGRSSDGMNKGSRSFHVNDIGVVSEGTVDSADVGVNIYASSDPNLKNHRGLKNHEASIESANRHCSAVLLAAGANHDDQNRINFISIQSSHVISAKGYHPAYVRTGYESMIAERMNPLFAYTAKEDGKVLKVSDKGVIIQYKDGKKLGLEVGRQFGRSEGSIFPFDIEAAVKEGDDFKKGQAIVYNTSYFQFDPWNPGQLVLKNSLTAKTVLRETKQTHEDASSISKRLAEKMRTRVTYMRSFVVEFGQNIHHVVKPGQSIQPQDILMSIEDEITSNLGSFGESAIETLKGLSKQSPRSNYFGNVDRIEVFYHGDKDQMSSSLRKLTEQSDNFISEQAKATAKPKFTGSVNSDYRVEGTPLGLNKAEIRFYLTVNMGMGVADKQVFANQMKSVNSEVMDYKLYTESGEEIDAEFGCRSIAARNVLSPYILGTTITLQKKFAQLAVKMYNS